MDINMPVMDGIRATEEITLAVPETTVIIVSVRTETSISEGYDSGSRGYLLKPFSGSELSEMINSSVKRSYASGKCDKHEYIFLL